MATWYSPHIFCECGKVAYDKKGAITAKNKRWKEEREKLRVYQCNGKWWHLTSKL